ncbi:hypothetical protein IWQ62_002210 [Dispira parvispora]|uniref:Uncharacterized protein n=1 Tax=Dispira parvispora TaxID=1520584 RepID=A0A9W8E877_9FUNG|nr:hypothetical protein IWQ62_002210 [Dispira parvispora]
MRLPPLSSLMTLYLLVTLVTVHTSPAPFPLPVVTTDRGEIQHLQPRFLGALINIAKTVGSAVSRGASAASKTVKNGASVVKNKVTSVSSTSKNQAIPAKSNPQTAEKAKANDAATAAQARQAEARKQAAAPATTAGSNGGSNTGSTLANTAMVAPALLPQGGGSGAAAAASTGTSTGTKMKYLAGGGVAGVGGMMLMGGSGEESGQEMGDAVTTGADALAGGATGSYVAADSSVVPNNEMAYTPQVETQQTVSGAPMAEASTGGPTNTSPVARSTNSLVIGDIPANTSGDMTNAAATTGQVPMNSNMVYSGTG